MGHWLPYAGILRGKVGLPWHRTCLMGCLALTVPTRNKLDGAVSPHIVASLVPKLPGSPWLASDLVISGVGNPPQTPADRGRVRMQVEVCVGTRVPCSLWLVLSHQETVPHQPLLLPLGSLSGRCRGDK